MSDTIGFYNKSGDLLYTVGKPPAPDPTALALLMEILKRGCTVVNHARKYHRETCFYCKVILDNEDERYRAHKANCPYLVAITLYGDPNSTDKPTGTIKAT